MAPSNSGKRAKGTPKSAAPKTEGLCLVDAVAAKSSPTKPAAKADDTDLQALVAKAKVDNMKGWTENELYGNRDEEGFTAMQRLEERKKLHLENPKKWPCGKNFYTKLRATFRDKVGAVEQPAAASSGGGDTGGFSL